MGMTAALSRPKAVPRRAPEAVARPAILANPTQQTLLEAAASLVKEAQVSLASQAFRI